MLSLSVCNNRLLEFNAKDREQLFYTKNTGENDNQVKKEEDEK